MSVYSCQLAFAPAVLKNQQQAKNVSEAFSVSTSAGPVSATTVNGSVTARMDKISGDEDMDFSTVNGSVRIEVPKECDADVRFDTSVVLRTL